MTRFLLVAAVLATGCEQIKAPKKLKELEGRVDELTAQVEKMTGKPMASRLKDKDKDKHEDEGHAAPKEGDGKGAGEEASAKEAEPAKEGEAKEGEAKEAEPAAAVAKDESKESSEGKPKDEASKESSEGKPKDEEPKAEDKPKDGDGEKKDGEAKKDGDAKETSEPKDDKDAKGKDDVAKADKRTKDERALDDIAKLVASTTGKKKPAEGDDKVAKAKAKDKDTKDKPKEKPAAEWGYNAKVGPPVWGSLDPAWRTCEQGRAQSPVDIEPRAGKAGPIVFHYKATPGAIVDNGRALQVDFGEGSWIEVSDHTYQLVQLNFHTPSEHTIAGEHYPLEAQLVHKDSGGKLAVISVLYDIGPESRAVGGLLAKWPRKPGAAARLPGGLDPATLLPETRTAFRYTGSLTTPPCTEGVIWNVMRRQLTDSRAHLDAFTARYKINARETRPLNDRKIE